MSFGWLNKHVIREAPGDEPYEYILEWNRPGLPLRPAQWGANWAGLATGIMVVASLLGSRLNAWYRLSLLVLSMVSAHIFWHLSYDAYASVHQSMRAESANVGP